MSEFDDLRSALVQMQERTDVLVAGFRRRLDFLEEELHRISIRLDVVQQDIMARLEGQR